MKKESWSWTKKNNFPIWGSTQHLGPPVWTCSNKFWHLGNPSRHSVPTLGVDTEVLMDSEEYPSAWSHESWRIMDHCLMFLLAKKCSSRDLSYLQSRDFRSTCPAKCYHCCVIIVLSNSHVSYLWMGIFIVVILSLLPTA